MSREPAPRAPGKKRLEETSDDVDTVPKSRRERQHKRGSRRSTVSSDELEDMRELIRALREELRALRRDNELLRRAQLTDPWQHPSPYYPPVAPMAAVTSIPPPALPASAHTPPRQLVTAATVPAPGVASEDPAMHVDRSLGPHHREPGDTPDGKRPPKAVRALEVNANNDD